MRGWDLGAGCALRRGRERGGSKEPEDHALGRSRGGFTTKVHLICDRRGTPLGVAVSAGQAHESRYFLDVFEASRLPPTRKRARYRPNKIAGDKGYNVESIRHALRKRGIEAVIPRRVPDATRDGPFDRRAYRDRNVIERCIGWLKECRRVSSRYDKRATSYLAFVKLAILRRLFKFDFSDGA